MDFLTDENIYTRIVQAVRSLGHDVMDIKKQNWFTRSLSDFGYRRKPQK